MFCPGRKCPWYGKARQEAGRKCYYDPRCWRGRLDVILTVIKRRKSWR